MGKIIKEIAQKQRDGSYERIALGATKVSELQNDSEFLTKDSAVLEDYPKYEEFGAVAFSNKYKDLDGKPAPYTLPIASEFELGGVMIGPQGLTISENGYLNAKTATDTELGVVQVDGTTVKVDEAGVISVVKTEHSPIPATSSSLGVVKPDNMTTKVMADGTMYVNIAAVAPLASAITPGVVQPDGTTIKIDEEGIISASQAQHSPTPATTTQIGAVKPDGVSIMIDSDGTLWIPPDLGVPNDIKMVRGTYSGTQNSRSKKVHVDIGIAPIYVVVHGPSTHSAGWVTGIAEIMSDHMMANINWDIESDYSMTDVTRFDSTYLDESGFYIREFQLSGNTYDYVAFYY